eukprot:TRINITY_DN20654_c0_g1_i1.p3 TRINITY_DN20654_c0_g1~~TRINITY_DN20654_c0_g1_i1.p3  ORF type:complete len:124 (-),score=6.72 TRINITY_DN20654_c0_g1_i1:441-812(-)
MTSGSTRAPEQCVAPASFSKMKSTRNMAQHPPAGTTVADGVPPLPGHTSMSPPDFKAATAQQHEHEFWPDRHKPTLRLQGRVSAVLERILSARPPGDTARIRNRAQDGSSQSKHPSPTHRAVL